MSQYPDENEEYELLYQDELELLDELQPYETIDKDVQPSILPSSVKSPQLSQLFANTQDISAVSELSDRVNRRLFGTPIGVQRGCSTPMVNQKKVTAPIQNVLDDFNEPCVSTAVNQLQKQGLACKRRLEEQLFGNIDDLYSNDTYEDPVAKKQRTEEEHDFEVIEKILDARKRYRECNELISNENILRLQAVHKFKMQNLSYIVPSWPFIILRRVDGQTVFVRQHSEEYETREIKNVNNNCRTESVLGESKQKLWDSANEIINRRLTLANKETQAQDVVMVESNNNSNVLWVEKYKPSKYIDLLSDESTNRSLLYWIKMWDKVVFGRELKVKQPENNNGQLNNFNKRTGKFESNGGWKRKKDRRLMPDTNIDEFGRPVQKIALLCGPPGLGKTTLAHTIAKHAGYNVLEINASDDRSPAAFRAALENGTQMTAVLNKDNRPNCIILDEIDGAPRQSIEFLVKFVNDAVATKNRSKRGNSKRFFLKRPIICICNDMYEPALRPLRQMAFVASFPQLESTRLAERLVQITYAEKLSSDFFALLALAEKSGNDVRSCMSTLQFFSAQKMPLTVKNVLRSNLGQKDQQQGLFDIWGAVFRIQRPKKHLDTGAAEEEDHQVTMTDMSVKTRFQNVLNVIHSAGDYERLIQGVYENYLHQKMPTSGLSAVVEALQWFCFSDALTNKINTQQNYTIYPYYQYGFVAWHLLFASLAWPKINFPRQGYEQYQKQTNQKNIFQSLRRGMSPQVQGVGMGSTILVDVVPYLKRILSPQLRSVPVQLLSSKEHYNLKHAIDVMIDFGLTYNKIKNSEGSMLLQMEPEMDALCSFTGYPVVKLNHFGRQLISRQVMIECIRRAAPKSADQTEKTKKVPNHLQVLKPKISEKHKRSENQQVYKNFFSNFQSTTPAVVVNEAHDDQIVKSPIWYHFKEGFNNAVRKNTHLKDLI
ncbi:chromosome transmission fidelity protein 18 homolog isoform X2 [Teleopsis dalmanni]|uniref:chromosome transmission fidelity protein 18 homolog isoform X2 n=1 Tax=Teleopsis dalmanni TaxID=139649 RepID=UPI0018CE56CE|nr:chromosome transmission fidelity protein 18 homolog isoform X2 [Teleopsis dalmanni]